MESSINSRMAVTGETSPKTSRPTPPYFGTTSSGEPREFWNKLERLYTLRYGNKLKKTKMDNAAAD